MEILKFFGIMALAALIWVGFSEYLNLGFLGITLGVLLIAASFYFKWFDAGKM